MCTDSLGCTSNLTHRINTKDEIPVRRKAYLTPIHKKLFIDDEIATMLEKGIIRPSTSPWAAPLVLVPKKDGSMSFCVDYRALNTKTPLDGFPMPQMHDIHTSLHGVTVFSTLDLRSGYWQVRMEEASISETAFVIKTAQYEFLRLPLGKKMLQQLSND